MAHPALLLLLLLLQAPPLSATAEPARHRCVHDALYAHHGKVLTPPHSQSFPEGAYDAAALARSLAVGTSSSSPAAAALAPLAPLRITPVFARLAALPAALRTFLTATLVPAAIAAWQARLSVVPAPGPLFAYRDCASVWTGTPTLRCAEFVRTTYCIQGFDGVELPLTEYLGTDFYYPSGPNGQASVPPTGSGFPATDFALLVTAVETPVCGGGGGEDVLAYAQTCQRDPASDRPTIGRINFCPSALSAAPAEWAGQLSTAVHEMSHAMGFTSDSLPLFRNPDGSPQTPRSAYDPTAPSDAHYTEYTCAGDGETYSAYLASARTVAYAQERGAAPCAWTGASADSYVPLVDGVTQPRDCVARLVTPHALAAGAWYSGCAATRGLELDSSSACALYGSHYAARALAQELMSPLLWHATLTSAVTLAWFADSGWYGVAWGGAAAPAAGDWGFRAGCGVSAGGCWAPSDGGLGSPAPAGGAAFPHFYTSNATARALPPAAAQRYGSRGTATCTTDARALAFVDVQAYAEPLPPRMQYFAAPQYANWGGYAEYDYCVRRVFFVVVVAGVGVLPQGAARLFFCVPAPLTHPPSLLLRPPPHAPHDPPTHTTQPVPVPYSGYTCATSPPPASARARGETFGSGTRCMLSTLAATGGGVGGQGAGCYAYTCSPPGVSPATLTVTLAGGASGVCLGGGGGGALLTFPGFSGALTCPPSVADLCSPAPAPPFVPPTALAPGGPSPTPSPPPRPTVDTLTFWLAFRGPGVSPGALAGGAAALERALAGIVGSGVARTAAPPRSIARGEDAADGGGARVLSLVGEGGGEGGGGGGGGAASGRVSVRRALSGTTVGVSLQFSVTAGAARSALGSGGGGGGGGGALPTPLPSGIPGYGALVTARAAALGGGGAAAALAAAPATSPAALGYASVTLDAGAPPQYLPAAPPRQTYAAPPSPGALSGSTAGGGGGGALGGGSFYTVVVVAFVVCAVVLLASVAYKRWARARANAAVVSSESEAQRRHIAAMQGLELPPYGGGTYAVAAGSAGGGGGGGLYPQQPGAYGSAGGGLQMAVYAYPAASAAPYHPQDAIPGAVAYPAASGSYYPQRQQQGGVNV